MRRSKVSSGPRANGRRWALPCAPRSSFCRIISVRGEDRRSVAHLGGRRRGWEPDLGGVDKERPYLGGDNALSIADAAALTSVMPRSRSRRKIERRVDLAALEAAMSSSRPECRPLLRRLAAPPPLLFGAQAPAAGYGGAGGAADAGGVDDLFALLERIAAGAADAAATARALAVAAEALALRAGSAGGLRSGPASNGEWTPALVLMRADRRAEAVAALAAVRERWRAAGDARMLVRAARHYEGAAAVCTSLCVRSCLVVSPSAAPAPPEAVGHAQAPARIDLAGGWWTRRPSATSTAARDRAAIRRGPLPDRRRAAAARSDRPSVDGGVPTAPNSPPRDHCTAARAGRCRRQCWSSAGWSTRSRRGAPRRPQARAARTRSAGRGCRRGRGSAPTSILAAASSQSRRPRRAPHGRPLPPQVEQLLTTGGGWQDQVGGILPGGRRARRRRRCRSP